ncbi:MAG TPA: HAD family phosphatase [Terriglobales bacterium]|nr:HAD family phosphatase [Terriglobales bacterium]
MSAERLDRSPNISAVILDYGQVLARCPTVEEFGRMAEMFNVSFELFFELWEASRGPYDRGDLTAEEYWLKLAAQTDSSIDRKQIEILRGIEVEIWDHPNPGMFEWVSQLCAAGLKTGLLSNMPWDLVNHVRTNCNWMENFTFKTLSAEVRLIKPDPAIYEHTLRGLGVSAAETLFVDDREPNISAARTLGMHAIQFQSIAQFRDDLEAFGFPILPTCVESATAVSGTASTADRPDRVSKFSPLL